MTAEVMFTSPPEWVDRAMFVMGRMLEKTWHLDLDGPCWALSNGYVTLILRSDGTAPLTEVVDNEDGVGYLTPKRLERLCSGSRDYPPACIWGDVSMKTLRLWCGPEKWMYSKPGEEIQTRSLVLAHSDGRKVVFNRVLVWKLLNELPGDSVQVAFDGPRDPIHLTAPGWRLLVMPRLPKSMDIGAAWTWKKSAPEPLQLKVSRQVQ